MATGFYSPAANALNIGMAVDGSRGNFGLGSQLQQQVANETDEERKRRLAQLAAQRAGQSPLGSLSDLLGGGPKAAGMSPAVSALGIGRMF